MNVRVSATAVRTATRALSHQIEWLGMRLAVPDDWQIIRHALRPQAGRLVLVDRRRERCSLIWTHCPERPDLDRLVEDTKDRTGDERALRWETFTGDPRWSGFVESSTSSGELRTSVVHWDAAGERLIELVVHSPADDPGERNLVTALIKAVRFVAAPGAARRWRAFDVDVTVPDGYRLVRLEPRPADATLTFRESSDGQRFGRQEVVIRRMGMAASWHDEDLERLARRLEPAATVRSVEHLAQGRVLVSGLEAGRRYRRLLGLLRTQRTLLWASAVENAVYVVTTRGKPSDRLRPTDVAVAEPEGRR